jgi:hypothetical protein
MKARYLMLTWALLCCVVTQAMADNKAAEKVSERRFAR